MIRSIIILIAISTFLSGCNSRDGVAIGQLDELGVQSSEKKDLSPSEAKLSLDRKAGNEAGQRIAVLSGRLVPVADNEKKEIVGWRVLGELLNTSNDEVPNAQIFVNMFSSAPTGTETTVQAELKKTVMPDWAQSGGFFPIRPNERSVYDVFLSRESVIEEVSMNVAIREQKEQIDTALRRLEIKNLSLVQKSIPKQSQEADASSSSDVQYQQQYIVRGTLKNDLSVPVKDLLVRFWMSENTQVIAVGTWRASQDVLAPSEIRAFESELTPLTQADIELVASSSAVISAMGAGTVL